LDDPEANRYLIDVRQTFQRAETDIREVLYLAGPELMKIKDYLKLVVGMILPNEKL
jgi:hypothetical protein